MKFPLQRIVFALMLVLGTAHRVFAHSMYQSAVLLDLHARSVDARLEFPASRLSAVFGRTIDETNLAVLRSELEAYILPRIHMTTAGKPWSAKWSGPVRWERLDGAPYVVAELNLSAPEAETARQFTLEDDVITDALSSQVVLVSVRSDWASSTFANDPELLGILTAEQRSIDVDRGAGTWTKGFRSVFHLGTRHIAEGTDHLLFLLSLLLPAPLLVAGKRWGGYAPAKRGLVQILKVVTAFTIGHSITLALAAFGVVHVPAGPVEVLIAASILVSAVHALRPIFPGKEPLVAASFGLIHGLAFASTLAELGLHGWERVASLLAFNLGIECMQVLVVVCVLPSLMLLSRTRYYTIFRVVGGSIAGLAAGGWLLERGFGANLRIDQTVNVLAQHSLNCATLLFVVSSLLFLRARSSPLISQP